jgi:heat-inducible transcriptional repressor
MTDRKKKVLNAIIREHIATKAPVGSSAIVEKYRLNVSSATVRNIMAGLEEDGYITQPYTSAGRIPTARAYREYADKLEEAPLEKTGKRLRKAEKQAIDEVFAGQDRWELKLKKVAKILAEVSGVAVFWAFYQYNMYYTGVSNLLSQPEFTERDLIFDISAIIDSMDDIINENFENFREGPQIMIGGENPFGAFCGTVLSKYRINKRQGLFGILGPLRMDYKKDYSLISYVMSHLNAGDPKF